MFSCVLLLGAQPEIVPLESGGFHVLRLVRRTLLR
jgi:hypothetical protein